MGFGWVSIVVGIPEVLCVAGLGLVTGVELVGHFAGVVSGVELVVVTGVVGHCAVVVGQGVGHEAEGVWDVVNGDEGTFVAAGRSFDRRPPSA